MSEGTTRYEVHGNGVRLVTLRPSDAQSGIGFRYSYRTIKGRVNPPVDTLLVCRMPCSTLRPVQVTGGVNVLDRLRKPEGRGQRLGTHFRMEQGDTVYAARRGVVTEVRLAEKRAEDAPRVSFTRAARACRSSRGMVRSPGISASTERISSCPRATRCCPGRRWPWRVPTTGSVTT